MDSTATHAGFVAGFVALVGRPNVGKSTLLNQILGQKIAIATPRPQTTRNRILGVKNVPGAQLVLVDTPGLHRPTGRGRSRLNQFMVGEALAALEEVDAVVLIVEAPTGAEAKKLASTRFALDAGNQFAVEELARTKKPAVLAVNKVDLLHNKQLLLPIMEGFGRVHPWAAMVPISAKSGDGVERLLAEMVKLLPAGAPLYPEEMITDRAERWLGAELVREQVFLLTKQEVPYAVAVTIDEWDERQKGDVMVSATIHVEKEAQKKIVVGEGGRMVREIGSRARHEIAQLLGCPVHLKLFVRVDEGWTGDRAALRDMGYERDK
ncbi:MAG TPA: GTPase Era [Polyangia bacterium]|nr:GTPase Era [Polyangia bacterium]